MKECKECKETKSISEFYVSKGKPNSCCKVCFKIKSKRYRDNNKEKRRATNKKWREDNPTYNRKWREDNPLYMIDYLKKWREDNKDYYVNYYKDRVENDELFRLSGIIRTKTRLALFSNYWTKNSGNYDLLKCNQDELKTHFENRFTSGMNWDNYGQWEIDHIVPLSSANNIDELLKLSEYTNLQPLWKEDNRKKRLISRKECENC